MELVKTILLYILKVLGNLAMLAIAFFVYKKYVNPITAHTVAPDHFQEILGVLILMIVWPLLSIKRMGMIRNVSLGIAGLLIPLVIFLVYFLNNTGSVHSYQRSFPIETKERKDNDMVIGAYVYEKSGRVHYKIPYNDCTRLDSVRIVIKDGLLGMKIITDEINLLKKANCGG